MRLTKRQRELIPETRWSITKGAMSYFFREDDKGGGRAAVTTDEERVLRGRSTEMRLLRYGLGSNLTLDAF